MPALKPTLPEYHNLATGTTLVDGTGRKYIVRERLTRRLLRDVPEADMVTRIVVERLSDGCVREITVAAYTEHVTTVIPPRKRTRCADRSTKTEKGL